MNKGQLRKKWRYFFIEGKLHKLVRANYARDEAFAWSYEEDALKVYQYSDIRRRASRGFTYGQIAKLVKRTTRQVRYYQEWGLIEPAAKVYDEEGKVKLNVFTEEQVFKIQEIVASMSCGRPRADGIINSRRVVSKEELYAEVKHDIKLYMRTDDGRFVPLYEAEDW